MLIDPNIATTLPTHIGVRQDGKGACNIPGATYWVLSARLRRKAFFIIDCRRPNSGGGAMIAKGQSTFHGQISCKIFYSIHTHKLKLHAQDIYNKYFLHSSITLLSLIEIISHHRS